MHRHPFLYVHRHVFLTTNSKNTTGCITQIFVFLYALVHTMYMPLTHVSTLQIYDGKDNTTDLMGTYCGSSLPPTMTATGSDLFITFQTDATFNYDGFQVNWDRKYLSLFAFFVSVILCISIQLKFL